MLLTTEDVDDELWLELEDNDEDVVVGMTEVMLVQLDVVDKLVEEPLVEDGQVWLNAPPSQLVSTCFIHVAYSWPQIRFS